MAERKSYDVEAIERVYRAGQLSDREIAAQFGCSHTMIQKYAKKYGWLKDLSSRVRKEVASKLVATVASCQTDAAIVDAAATIGANLVQSHRADIRSLRELEASLIEELMGSPSKLYITQYQGEIVKEEVALTASERSAAAANLAQVQHKRIALERQAFGIDDAGAGSGVTVTLPAELLDP